MIQSFKEFIVEMSYEDIFKRNNKDSFINKAISGDLILNDGSTLPKIDPGSDLIKVLNNISGYSGDSTKDLQAAIKKDLGVSIGKIDKASNGFSGGRGGGSGPNGAEWEEIICVAYNMQSKNVDADKAKELAGVTKSWKDKFDPYLKTGHEIVKSAFGRPSGIMEHFGSGSAELTKGWDQYFIKTTGKPAGGPTKTPKTDMYIGKQHISLKKYGGSQLMSGGKAETLATLAFAYENTPDKIKSKELDRQFKGLVQNIADQYVGVNLPSGATIGTIKKDIKAGKKSKLIDTVRVALSDQNAMTAAVQNIFEHKDFKAMVVREAMTGENKFADYLPRSSHMMKFAENGQGEYVKIDSSLVNHYAKATSFNISFKTSGAGGRAWTALKGIYKEDVEDLYQDLLIESFEETEQEYLTEGMLSKVGGAIVSFIKRMIMKLWEKLKALAMQGVDKLQTIFNLTMTIINSPSIMI